MSANLEIKAPVSDPASFREKARELATETVGIDDQVDTYFRVPTGRLKLRESSLDGGLLVPYMRPDDDGPRRADYQLLPSADPAGLKALLSAMLGVHRIVKKRREIWLHENVRIHLDAVEGLGAFMELEAVYDGSPAAEAEQQKKVAYLMKELEVADGDLIATSYEALLDSVPAD